MAEVAIKGKDVVKVYGDLRAVSSVSFEVYEGECFGFLGPNGAGKTTVMKLLYGYTPLTEGSIKVLGMDVARDLRRIKSTMGIVPQEDNLDPDLTVFENLVVYARYFGITGKEGRQRAEELLDFLYLTDRRDFRIKGLSGGMKRRLIIARALLNRPRILLLDEPTTGLDPQARHLIWQKLRQLKREGATMCLTTHYMEEAEQLCDRVVVMDGGKILVQGEPKELVHRNVGGAVVEIRVPDEVDQHFLSSLKEMGVPYEFAGDTLYLFCPDGHSKLEELLDEAFHKSRLFFRRANLEDLFLRLTGRGLRE